MKVLLATLLFLGAQETPILAHRIPEPASFWRASKADGREAIACILTRGDTLVAILPVEPEWATSGKAGIQRAHTTCAPPLWNGTIHTHIEPPCIAYAFTGPGDCRVLGKTVLPVFSPSDYAAIHDWVWRWGTKPSWPAAFCVISAPERIFCQRVHVSQASHGETWLYETFDPVVGR